MDNLDVFMLRWIPHLRRYIASALLLNLIISSFYVFIAPQHIGDSAGLWGYTSQRFHIFTWVGLIAYGVLFYMERVSIRRSQEDAEVPIYRLFEAMAEAFHETYERLAPDYGYQTRLNTRNFDPKSANGLLMIATIRHLADTGQIVVPGYQSHMAFHWVFDEDPAELAERLQRALTEQKGHWTRALRQVFIHDGVQIRLEAKRLS